jgi:putative oxidoreductase
MLTHGIPKLITFFGSEEIVFADPVGFGESVTFTFAVFAEFVCAILILLGWGTRFAAIPLVITMAVAAIIVHWTDGFARQELPLLYMGGFLLLFFTGAGKFSLDYYLLKKEK